MSILFGIYQEADHMVTKSQLAGLASATGHYAPDGLFLHACGRIGMGFQPNHTHQRSKLDSQPAVDGLGNMLTFDGRIDNHAELCRLLDIRDGEVADSSIVLAAFDHWREDCFSRLIGDWALALWSCSEQSLYLARDHAGTRALYFSRQGGSIRWSTYLETFFAEGQSFDVDEVYAAHYLASRSAGDRTPYKDIKAVLPAHFAVFHEGEMVQRPHWRWMAPDKIYYNSDTEYEEHFLGLFRQAVERRTGPGAPILAELSGGMDSTSIVCMSDRIRLEQGALPAELLDTVSYYDDCDPHWNEAPYFSCVEAQRRKQGIHLPLPLLSVDLEPAPVRSFWPGKDRTAFENEQRFAECIRGNDYRVILSGMGGDELLGGVPTAIPELADYLAAGQIATFARRALAWCLVDRTPFMHMTLDTIGYLLDQYSSPKFARSTLPPWSTTKLEQLLHQHGHDAWDDSHLFGIEPSRIGNGRAWWILLETLPHRNPGLLARYEYRYPYLDRDLVDFLFRVPRERLLQPGRRRAMMRSALRGIVPAEVLERRRKAFRSRAAISQLRAATSRVASILEHSYAAADGLIGQDDLPGIVLRALQDNEQRWTHAVVRLVLFELWREGFREDASGRDGNLSAQTFVA